MELLVLVLEDLGGTITNIVLYITQQAVVEMQYPTSKSISFECTIH